MSSKLISSKAMLPSFTVRFGRDRRHRRRYRVVYMDERPDPRAIADDRRHALAGLLRARAVWTIPGARPIEESIAQRSEEHTSEIQSLMRISYAVFCLIKQIKK